jgi:hypothetical protein
LNRRAALVMLNDKIKVEMSGNAEWQRRTKPNKRLHPTGNSLSVIVNLNGFAVVSRRVNRGVMRLTCITDVKNGEGGKKLFQQTGSPPSQVS